MALVNRGLAPRPDWRALLAKRPHALLGEIAEMHGGDLAALVTAGEPVELHVDRGGCAAGAVGDGNGGSHGGDAGLEHTRRLVRTRLSSALIIQGLPFASLGVNDAPAPKTPKAPILIGTGGELVTPPATGLRGQPGSSAILHRAGGPVAGSG